MTRTDMPLKQATVSSSTAQESAERSSVGTYTIYNDIDIPVTVLIMDGQNGNPLNLIALIPGGTSDSFSDGSWAAVLFLNSNWPVYQWSNGAYWYHKDGPLHPNQVNVSSIG